MDLRFGFEIELVGDGELISYPVRPYHNGRYTEISGMKGFWKCESDSSLEIVNEDKIFLSPTPAEFISKVLTMKNISKAIKIFKEYFTGGEKGIELNEIISFNKTCGCHIHFSDSEDLFNSMISTDYLIKIRDRAFKRIKRELPEVFPHFVKQYFRPTYASKLREKKALNLNREREFAFHDTSRGAEWRSFNLSGVTSWEQLEKLLTIGVECIKEVLEEYKKEEGKETLEIDVPTVDIDFINNFNSEAI